MTVDPADLVGQTFDGDAVTVTPWLAHLWTAATTDATALQANDHGSDQVGNAVTPPTLAVAIAREAAPLSALEERLREGERAERPVFLGGHRFWFARPIRVEATYYPSARVASVDRKTGRRGAFDMVTVVSEAADESGSIAFELETDIVVRAADSTEMTESNGADAETGGNAVDDGGGSDDSSVSEDDDKSDEDDADETRATIRTTADRLAVGTPVGRLKTEVDPTKLQLLSAILRDPNPIHYDPAVAAEAGHAGRVAQGPISAEFLAQAALEFAESAANLRSLNVRYESFVLENETVTATATVSAVDREEETVTLDLVLRKADGTVAATGTAVADVGTDRLESIGRGADSGH